MPTAVAGMRSVLAPLASSGNPNADAKNGLSCAVTTLSARKRNPRNQAAKTVDTGAPWQAMHPPSARALVLDDWQAKRGALSRAAQFLAVALAVRSAT